MSPYSLDLRQRIVDCYENGEATQKAIAAKYSVCQRTVASFLKLKRETGDCAPKPRAGGPKFKLDEDEKQRLKDSVRAQPDATLEELKEKLGLAVSIMTIHRALKRMKARYKKKPSRQ